MGERAYEVIEKLKKSRLLVIQDNDRIHTWVRDGWDRYDASLDDYDKNYLSRLKDSLGIDTVIVRSDELIAEIGNVKEKAEEIADMWIKEAKEVTKVTRGDVIRSAELYVSYKELLNRYESDGITMASWALVPDGKIKAMPPLAEMELAKELIPCCCESDMDSLVTLIIGTYISSRPGIMGDLVSNWVGLRREDGLKPLPENYVAIGHCYGPINPHGNDRLPYVIRDHAYYELGWGKTDDPRVLWKREEHLRANRQLKKENITLVAIRVEWTAGEVVTIVKFDPYNRKALVFTGKTFDPHPFFKDFDNTVCRTKIAIETNVPFNRRLGGHMVAFYGDIKKEVKNLAELVDFEVYEK
jgi:hypothetical protein